MLVAVALAGCSEISNVDLLLDTKAQLCADVDFPTVQLAAPTGRVGQPWLGLVEVSRGGEIEAEGLPAGIQFDTQRLTMSGVPKAAGDYDVTVRAYPGDCPDAAGTTTETVRIQPECDGDCDVLDGCTDDVTESLDVWIDDVSPGTWLALNALKLKVNVPGQLVLTVPESRDKKEVVVHYALPGGPPVPWKVDTELIDLRYYHGHHDDRYLFMKRGHSHAVLSVYRGYLPPEWFGLDCPGGPQFCQFPLMERVPTECDCTVMLRTEDADMLPGDVSKLGGRLTRLVQASECAADTPWWIELWQTDPYAPCDLTEVRTLIPPGDTAPTAAFIEGRILPSDDPVHDITVEGIPDFPVSATKGWVDMPLAGRYRVFTQSEPKCPYAASVEYVVAPAKAFRIEAWWDGGGSVPLRMLVDGHEADLVSGRVLARDTDDHPWDDVAIFHDGRSGPPATVHVRLVSRDGVKETRRELLTLFPGESWSRR